MKLNLLKSSLLVASLIASSSVMAESSGFYGVVGFQHSTVDEDLDIVTDLGLSVDDNDTSYNFAIGYEYNQYVSIELGYVDLGEISVNPANVDADGSAGAGVYYGVPYSYTGTLTGSLDSAKAESDGFTLGGVFSYPATKELSVYAKAGWYFWDADASASATINTGSLTVNGTTYNPGDYSDSYNDSGSDLYLGLGAEYDFSDTMAIRGEYTRYDVSDVDIDSFGLALKVKF